MRAPCAPYPSLLRWAGQRSRTPAAVAEQDRQGVLMPGAHVQKMDAQAIDLCTVLAETVEHRLATAPVIFCSPVVYQREDPRRRYALRPVGNRLAVCHRVISRRRLRSSSALCGTLISKGVTSEAFGCSAAYSSTNCLDRSLAIANPPFYRAKRGVAGLVSPQHCR